MLNNPYEAPQELATGGYIDGARDVSKCNTTNVATFDSPLVGHLGLVQDGVAHYYKASTRCHTKDSEFDVRDLKDCHG